MTETTTGPAPVTSRLFTESVSLFVDPLTRAYTLGRAVEIARERAEAANRDGRATILPKESEVFRAMLDAEIDRVRESSPATYNRIIEVGRAEMARRGEAREK